MFERLTALFNKTRSQQTTLKTDLHSHLIPGIDDGAKTMEESMTLIRALKSLGYDRLITTPHIMSHRYPNTSGTILRGLDRVREAVQKEKIDVTIDAASEYYLDEHLMTLIAKKDILTFSNSEMLFEMSYVIAPPDLKSIVKRMQDSGFNPVLAHPERYLFLHDSIEHYAELKNLGVRFQVNINSLGGYYSKPVQRTARKIMQEGWIDYLGSDTHHMRQINALTNTLRSNIVQQVVRNNTLFNHWL